MQTLLSRELDDFRVHLKSFAPRYRCRWPERVPGRLCVFLDGAMLEGSARYEPSDVVYKPPEDRPSLKFGDRGARTVTVELRRAGIDVLRSGGFEVEEPFSTRSSHCRSLAERMRVELMNGDDMTPLVLQALVLDLFSGGHRAKRSGPPPAWLVRVRECIDASYLQPKTLRDYASGAGVHPVRLAERFRKHYRSSVGDYIRELRVRRASGELSRTKRPIADIALDAGFADQSHLTRVFKRFTGRTPRQFRAGR